MDDESCLGALVMMFEQALKAVAALDEPRRAEFLARLDLVRQRCQHVGYGVGDDANDLWARHGRTTRLARGSLVEQRPWVRQLAGDARRARRRAAR